MLSKGGSFMEDSKIVELYLQRDENAIKETKIKYEKYCSYIANNILNSTLDTEECVNDTYLATWNSIPPNEPKSLRAYVGKIVRNIALNRYNANKAKKRNDSIEVVLDELNEVIGDSESDGRNLTDELTLKYALNAFVGSLKQETREIFVRRYWYLSSIKEIASDYGLKESKVKVTLLRTRELLREFLRKEGIVI
jgi:RNA polymerase sigma-70 factor (ECF subfamily)